MALPSVQAVGAISHVFLETNPDFTITVEGPAPSVQPGGALMDDVVRSGYFTIMGQTSLMPAHSHGVRLGSGNA